LAIGSAVALDRATDAGRARDLIATGENAAIGKVREAAVVVDVQVRQHHRLDVTGPDTEASQLWADFLFRFDVEANAQAKIRVPGWQRFQVCRGSGIDDD
jgi:hypothetical protein